MGKTYKDNKTGKYAEERRKREQHKKNKKANKHSSVDPDTQESWENMTAHPL